MKPPTPSDAPLAGSPCQAPVEGPSCHAGGSEAQARRFVPFFVVSLALTLTLGATLGTISLARLTGTWGQLPRAWVTAHGYVQLFGFVALFVMGFAFHAVPRFTGAPLGHARVVPCTLWLQTAGVLCIAVAFLLSLPPAWARGLWGTGGALLLLAAALFATSMTATVAARTLERQAFEPWLVAGAVWLVLAAATACVAAALDDTSWHHVLWAAALFGFAGSWIFGVGRRLFPASLGWRPRWPALDGPVFLVYQAGVAGWCAGAWPLEAWSRRASLLGAAALLVAVPLLAGILGLFATPRFRPGPRDRELRVYGWYVRAGWTWLAVGLLAGPGSALLAWTSGSLPSITMLDFSRHTLALGFVTQLVMGVGSRFIHAFTATWLWSPRAHAVAFWLLNAAVAIRCLQGPLALGYWPEVWPLLALSGPPAVAALGLFALNVGMALRTDSRRRLGAVGPRAAPLRLELGTRPAAVASNRRVGERPGPSPRYPR